MDGRPKTRLPRLFEDQVPALAAIRRVLRCPQGGLDGTRRLMGDQGITIPGGSSIAGRKQGRHVLGSKPWRGRRPRRTLFCKRRIGAEWRPVADEGSPAGGCVFDFRMSAGRVVRALGRAASSRAPCRQGVREPDCDCVPAERSVGVCCPGQGGQDEGACCNGEGTCTAATEVAGRQGRSQEVWEWVRGRHRPSHRSSGRGPAHMVVWPETDHPPTKFSLSLFDYGGFHCSLHPACLHRLCSCTAASTAQLRERNTNLM